MTNRELDKLFSDALSKIAYWIILFLGAVAFALAGVCLVLLVLEAYFNVNLSQIL